MSCLPSSMSTLQRSAMSSVDCSASGHSAKLLRHLLVGAQVELVRVEGHLRLRRASTSSARTAAPCGGGSPRGGGSGRRRSPTSGRPTSRAIRTMPSLALSWSAMPFFWTSKKTLSRPEDVEEVVGVGAGLVRLVLDEPLQKRLARQPVSAMTPSECWAICSRSTVGLPRLRPSRKPALEILTRLR